MLLFHPITCELSCEVRQNRVTLISAHLTPLSYEEEEEGRIRHCVETRL